MVLLLVVVVIMFAYYIKSESTTPRVSLLVRQLTKKRREADTETPPNEGTDEGTAMLPTNSGDIDHSMETEAAPEPAPETTEEGRSLRGFLGALGMEEYADALEAEGVGSLDDLKLLTDESQLAELGKIPTATFGIVHALQSEFGRLWQA
eukprot:COSAG04_NODE_2077_length_4851_cov_6.312921_7_plen_150_part_00